MVGKLRWLPLFLVFIVLLSACSSGTSTAPAPQPSASGETGGTSPSKDGGTAAQALSGSIEVGVLQAEGTSGYQFITDVAKSITSKQPGTKINFVFANTQARAAIDQRWRAGNPPDLDYTVFNAALPKTHEFVRNGLIENLKPYLEKPLKDGQKWLDTFSPAALPLMNLNGDYYAIPTELTAFGLFYNEKIFNNLGLQPPKTWNEFLKVGETLKANGIAPIAVTGQMDPYMEMWTDYLFAREVGYDKTVEAINGKGFADEPGFLSAAQKVQDIRDRGFFLKGFQGTDLTAAQLAFFQGKAGMILMGSWLASEMKDSIPAGFKLGITSFPTVEGGKGDPSEMFGTANMLSLSASSKSKPLAVEFLKTFTDIEVQKKRAAEMSLISPIKGVPAPSNLNGIDKVIGEGKMVLRYLGLEKNPELWNKYGVEVNKLFFGNQDAKKFISNLDKIAKEHVTQK